MNKQGQLNATRYLFIGMVVAFAAIICSAMLFAGTAQALSRGDTFTKNGNTYKITDIENDYDDDDDDDADEGDGEVTLVKYGSSDKSPSINTVTYQGKKFEIDTIGKKAFNTTAGHKIKSLTLGKNVDKIKSKAFYKCKKLKSINMRKCDCIDIDRSYNGYYIDEIDIASSAFKSAGKGTVKVKCGKSSSSYQKVFKKAMKKTGLKKFKVVK